MCANGKEIPTLLVLLASPGHSSLAMAAAARKGRATASPLASSPMAITTTAWPDVLDGWLSRIPCEYCALLSQAALSGGASGL